jgi:hypothetical protein
VAVVVVAELMLTMRMSTAPVNVEPALGVVSRAVGEMTTIWSNVTLMICASAEPKKT